MFFQQSYRSEECLKAFVVELSAGQMVEDVKLNVKNKEMVKFFGRLGGITPTPQELFEKIKEWYIK